MSTRMRLDNEKKTKMMHKLSLNVNNNKNLIDKRKKAMMLRSQRKPYSLHALTKNYFSIHKKSRAISQLKKHKIIGSKKYNKIKKNNKRNENMLSEQLKNMKELSIPLIRIDELFDIPQLCRRMDEMPMNATSNNLIPFENNNSIKNQTQYETGQEKDDENSSLLSPPQKLIGDVVLTNFVEENTTLLPLRILNENGNDNETIQYLLVSKTDTNDSKTQSNDKEHEINKTENTELDLQLKIKNEHSTEETLKKHENQTPAVSKVRENSRFKFDDPNHVLAMCVMCREVYSLIKQIKNQQVRINQGSSVKCLFCNLHFVTIIHLENHMSRTHLKCINDSGKNENFPIQIVNPENLTPLISTRSNITVECCCCFQTYQSLNDFEKHLKTKHQTLNEEGIENSSKVEWSDISKKNSNESRVMGFIICELCDIQFLNMRDYLKHIQQKHQDMNKRRNRVSNKTSNKTNRPRKKRKTSPSNESHCDDDDTEDNSAFKITVYPPVGSPVEIRHNDLPSNTDVPSNNEDDEFTTIVQTGSIDDQHPKDLIILEKIEHQCNICDKSLSSTSSLHEHMLLLHNISLSNDPDDPKPKEIDNRLDSSWRKSFNKGTTNLADLTSKQLNVRPIRSGKKQWHCPNCPESFDSIGACIHHRYYVHDDESVVHICENCSKVLTSVAMVNMHVCREVTSWECKRCDMNFSNSIELRAHNNNRHLEIVGPHTCTTCKNNFLTDFMMNRHISETHEKYKKERTSTPELVDILTSDNCNDEPTTLVEDNSNEDPTKCDNINSIYTQLVTSEKIKCSLCEFICDKRKNIKLHLLGKHKMDVEICELCEELFLKGTLNEHLINDHFVHNVATNEEDSHRSLDKYDFFDILGQKRILSLCGYYVFQTLKTNYHVECLICDRHFKNCSSFKLHNLWVHDNMCSICNMEFDDAHHAANHKLEVHKSIKSYFWLSEHVISSILKQQVYEDAIKGVISSIYSIVEGEEGTEGQQYKKEDYDVDDLNDNDIEMLEPEFLDDIFLNNNYPGINDNVEDLVGEPYISLNDRNDDLDDKEDVVLVITQEDLELYKNDIKTLVNKLSSSSKLSEEYLINLLTDYMKNNKNV